MDPPADRAIGLRRDFSIALLVVCPIIVALPPRKLDWYTFGLGVAWVWSGNNLVTERTGRSILGQFAPKTGLPTERARQVQAMLSRNKETPTEKMSTFDKVWLGNERSGWKEKRLREEEEALNDGKGYGGLIMDQLMEVWTGKNAVTREKEADEAEKAADAKEAAEEAAKAAAEKRG